MTNAFVPQRECPQVPTTQTPIRKGPEPPASPPGPTERPAASGPGRPGRVSALSVACCRLFLARRAVDPRHAQLYLLAFLQEVCE